MGSQEWGIGCIVKKKKYISCEHFGHGETVYLAAFVALSRMAERRGSDAVAILTVGGGRGNLSEAETEGFFPLAAFEFMTGVAVGSGSISSIAKEGLWFDKTFEA